MRLRFDVLTKRKVPELHRSWTSREGATVPAGAGMLHGVEAGVFPSVGRRVALQRVSVQEPVLGVAMTAERSLLRMMAAAQPELRLALEERKRARRALRRAEDRVRAARRQLRLVFQSAEPVSGPPPCEKCGATLGLTPHCVECAAARAFTDPREP